MPISYHSPLQFFCGDTWEIQWDCHRADGSPLSLVGARVVWKLDDMNGVNIKTKTTDDNSVLILDPPADGKCMLSLSGAETAGLTPGFYRDAIVVTTGARTNEPSIVTTQSAGRIEAVESLA